jgi:uncharacterized peroxidase-related enzyme
MPRINCVDGAQASSPVRDLFAKVEKTLGMIPNMFRHLANSTMGFDGFLKLKASLADGKLGGRLQMLITLATAEFNGCRYCVAANTKMGQDNDLLTAQECLDARRFEAADPREAALLKFVQCVLETSGEVASVDLKSLRNNGFGDEETVEILGTMVLTTYTNYVSNVAHPDMDFPPVPIL